MQTNYFNRRDPAFTERETPDVTLVAPQEKEVLAQPDSDTLPLVISIFNNEKDNTPQQRELTWSQLRGKHFTNHPIRKSKLGGMAMSPVSYKPGAKRGNHGVEMISCAVFDVEHHGPFDALQEKLHGYAYLAHSSYRHTVEAPRFRIILPLANPVQASQWPECWDRLNQWLGGINDPSTKDAARIYYLPSQQPDAIGHFIVSGEGKHLDIGELPELPPEQLAKVSTQATRNYLKVKIDGIEEFPPDPLNPAEGLDRVVASCKFMAETSLPEEQKTASRATWRAMISNASRFEDSDDWIHAASCHHEDYDKNLTDKEIKGLRDFGMPITCASIQQAGYAECPIGGCKTVAGKVTRAPAGLWVGDSRPVVVDQPETQVLDYLPRPVLGFQQAYFPGGLIYTNESFLGYEVGYWRMLEDRSEVRHPVGKYLGKGVTKAKEISNLFDMLKDFLAVKETDLASNTDLICLRNGTLGTSTYQLLPHNPEHGLTNKTDIDWDPTASCRTWLKFMDEIFINDIDKAKKISFLKEWFGYCLIPDASQHKFLWLVGAGGNGKSVLLAILTALVGPKNVSHAYMDRLDRGSVRAELENKLVNISSEMSAEATIADGYFKAIVSGDVLEAERKFKAPFSFKPYVRLIGATNHLPRLLDLSEGFFRRAIVLTFNRQFTGAEIDPALEGKLLEELPGILTWAMQGLRNLRARGGFDIPQSSIAALNQYRKDSDQVGLFAEECLEIVDRGGLSAAYIYEGYAKWCGRNGYGKKNSKGFGTRLAELGYVSYRSSSNNCWRVSTKTENTDWWAEAEVAVTHPTEVGARNTIFPQRYTM